MVQPSTWTKKVPPQGEDELVRALKPIRVTKLDGLLDFKSYTF